MTDVASLPGKWRDIARRLDGIERPSIAELARAETYRSVASHLESALAALSAAPSRPVVDEAMVERALAEYKVLEPSDPIEFNAESREFMRRLINAALGQQEKA